MAPLSNINETGTTGQISMANLPNKFPSTASSQRSSLNGLRKRRLQHYIRKLKKSLINYDSQILQTTHGDDSNNINLSLTSFQKPQQQKHMSTFDALERAIQLIDDFSNPPSSTTATLTSTTTKSSKSKWLKTNKNNYIINENINSMPIITSSSSSPLTTIRSDDVSSSAPPSPSTTSTSTSSSSSIENQQNHPSQRGSPSSETTTTLLSLLPPTSGAAATAATSDRLWGTVNLSLPDGIITNLWSSQNDQNLITTDLPNFYGILKKDLNLLELLQGKGAQTLLLNAFCGLSKRRMYARLKCDEIIRPFELLCEFTPNSKNPSICSAQIQILCLESAFKNSSSNSSATTIFTTRHNASCALIYLDSASIPYLGHFPSEITGKSLFTFIHADDVSIIQQAHRQLHATSGRVVSTPNLRLVSYNGTVIPVSSEWSAFVNPWTKSIEMIVGRHCINHQIITANAFSPESTKLSDSVLIPSERFRELDNFIHSFISKPIISEEQPPKMPTTAAATLNNEKKIKQEPMGFIQQQPQLQQHQHQNLRNYIDNVVETLVISQEEKQQVHEEIKTLQESTPILSYNQINCLENVHRLLKSQTKFLDLDGGNGKDGMKENHVNSNEEVTDESMQQQSQTISSNNIPLTRELLQQHNRKWEAECKDTWKKRLNMKRIASAISSVNDEKPPTKTPRIRSEPQAYSISTAPLPPSTNNNNNNNNRVISSTTANTHVVGAAATNNNNNGYIPPLPYPPPTPLDQQAWTEYVKIVQLHLQNMATYDHQQQQQQQQQQQGHGCGKRISFQHFKQQSQNHQQQQQRVQQIQQQHERHQHQLAALAMTFQQVQIPSHQHQYLHHHHSLSHHPHHHQSSTASSSPFNALPSLN